MLNHATQGNVRLPHRPGPAGASDSPERSVQQDSRPMLSCPACHALSPETRKFCAHCGTNLWEPCFQCGTLAAAGEKFCGACGADLIGGLEERVRRCRDILHEAERAVAEHRFEDALALLGPISRDAHARLDEFARRAAAMIQQVTQERTRRAAHAEAAFNAAQDRLAAWDYEGAIQVLDQIPVPLRTDAVVHLMGEAAHSAQEVATLSEELREAVNQKRADRLSAKLGRLLALKPDHGEAQRLAARFRRHLCETARQKLAQHRYDAALQALEQIPQPACDAEVDELREQAAELAWLWWNLRNAAAVDKVLLSIGERLVKQSPGDAQAQKLLSELRRRSTQAAGDPCRSFVPWARAPEQTHVGYPVEWMTGFQRIHYAEGFDPSLLIEHPGCFFVAAGLALQGLGLADVNINLLPRESSVLGRVGRLIGMRPAHTAWGIDLSSAGLKAIRLAKDPREGRVAVDACDCVEHRKLLSHAANEEEERALVEETLQTFAGRNDVKADRTCLGLPSRTVFSRQFLLPAMEPAKLPAAIQYEAKRIVPFSLDDLICDYECLDFRNADPAARNEQQVVLVAAKRIQLKGRLAALHHAGFKIDIVQCDHLALDNFFAYDLLDGEANGRQRTTGPGAAAVILDVGSDITNIVLIGSESKAWYHSGFGGHTFSRALLQQFHLTFTQAEELKRNPAIAPSLNRIQKAIDPVFEDLTTEIQRAVASLRKHAPHLKIERILGVGGGFRTHGLLRYLRLGR